MPVVQPLKEVRQYKAVIAFKGHPPGDHENPAVPSLWEGDIFRVQGESCLPEYLRRKGQQVPLIEAFCLVYTGNKLPELRKGLVRVLRDSIVEAEGLQDCCAQCFTLPEKGLIIFRRKDSQADCPLILLRNRRSLAEVILYGSGIFLCEQFRDALLLCSNVQRGKGFQLWQGFQNRQNFLPNLEKIRFVQISGGNLLLYIPVVLPEYGNPQRRVILIILIQKMYRKGAHWVAFATYMHPTIPVNGSKKANAAVAGSADG